MRNVVNLPFEILVDICSYVDIYSLYAFSITCKDLAFVIKHPPLWVHIEFTNPEEREQIELDFLNKPIPPSSSSSSLSSQLITSSSSSSSLPIILPSLVPKTLKAHTVHQKFSRVPYKLSRITDECITQLLKMLTKNNLVMTVNSIDLDFTSVTSAAILELISLLPQLEEVSLRGCQRVSLRGLAQDLSWYNPHNLQLKKLNVIWCRDMDPRIRNQDVLQNFSGILYFKGVLDGLEGSLCRLGTKQKIELDIGGISISILDFRFFFDVTFIRRVFYFFF